MSMLSFRCGFSRLCASTAIAAVLYLSIFSCTAFAQEKTYPFNTAQVKLSWGPPEYTFYNLQGKPLFRTATVKDKDAGSWGLTNNGKTGKFAKIKGLREKIQILLADIETDKKQMVRAAVNDRGNSMSIRFFHLKGNEIDSSGSMSVTFLSLIKDKFEYFKEKNGAEGLISNTVCLLLNPAAKGSIKVMQRGKKQYLHFSSPNYEVQVYAVHAENRSEVNAKKNKLLQILSFP